MTETTRVSVDKKIEGNLGHAAGKLAALWEIANKDDDTVSEVGDTGTSSNTSSVVSYFQFCLSTRVIRERLLRLIGQRRRVGGGRRRMGTLLTQPTLRE